MPLDGLVVSAIVHELQNLLPYIKIEKIYQPEADEIILLFRNQGKNLKLMISANSSFPRVQFTAVNKDNPVSPPVFCMLLRKHLQGSRVIDIQQPDFERIIKFKIESHDELNLLKPKELIVEMMGKHSNIILLDCETNKIIDSIKRVPLDVSRHRQVLPGLPYIMPPDQKKNNPLKLDSFDFFRSELLKHSDLPLLKGIYSAFTGISPVISREICHRANLSETALIQNMDTDMFNKLFASFYDIFSKIKLNQYTPVIYKDCSADKYIDFSVVPVSYLDFCSRETFPSVSQLLENFYAHQDQKERMKQKSQNLRKTIGNKLERLYHKINNLQYDLEKTNKAEEYRMKGDLITANLYQIEDRPEYIEVHNYFDENTELIRIDLDKSLSPSKNAQKYYKKYNKLKSAVTELIKQLQITRSEINYLEQIIVNIDQSTYYSDLEEIQHELIETGYLRKRTSVKQSKNYKKSGYLKFISSDGFEIFVGKNNKQNDEITFKTATKEDLWFHAKDMPGSHTVIKLNGKNCPDSTIYEAALLAAYYSKGKNSSKVPVDYTNRKNVHKISGAKPGMVTYDHYTTILVNAFEKNIEKIQQMP